jgi:hypothetical protein
MSDTPETPKLDEFTAALQEQGFGIQEGLPANHRLRAEVLAKLGKTEDATGYVSPELIADAAARLDAEKAEEEKAEATAPSMKWSRDDLAAEAARLNIELDASDTKATILAKIEAAPAAQQEG